MTRPDIPTWVLLQLVALALCVLVVPTLPLLR
jgi:hypothetical protein